MSTIIGCTHLIKHKRFKAKPSKAKGKYKERNQNLPYLGYSTYEEYLKSPEWEKIRDKILMRHPTCCCCDRVASQVHHYSYDLPVMLGLLNELLFSICDKCHEEIEFDGKTKRSLRETQKVFSEATNPNCLRRLSIGISKLSKYSNKSPKFNKSANYYREKSRNNFDDKRR